MNAWTVAAPILAALTSLLLGHLLIRHASRLGLQDVPNARSSHVAPRPRGGGTGIVLAFLVALPLGLPAGTLTVWNAWLPLAAALILALVGLADDVRGLGLTARLAAQSLAVAALLAALAWRTGAAGESDLGLLDTLTGLPWLTTWLTSTLTSWPSTHAAPGLVALIDILLVPLLILAGLWWINLFNFMDGIDGLAASQAFFMLAASLIIKFSGSGVETTPTTFFTAPESIATVILLAAVAGFLFLNWPPARIFMGDAGSLFLGFSIFALAALDVTYGDINVWCWLLLGSLFLVDATVTLLRRWVNGQPVTAAHRSHLYQRLSRRWGRHAPVTLVYCTCNIAWVFPLALLAQRSPSWAPLILVTACLPAALIAWHQGAGLEDS